jgi:L-asparaginase / beta-aspartyl-peptidase
MEPSIIVHGGATSIPPEQVDAKRAGCRAAANAGWSVLLRGGSAVEAVEAAVRSLENDPVFNAGYGSELNIEGRVQMDAGIMEGADLRAGAVAGIEGVRNPISVAKLLIEEGPVLVVGPDAREYAAEHGADLCAPEQMISPERQREWRKAVCEQPAPKGHDTVGCVAMDRRGQIATGASTGGLGPTQPGGRVGDSALVGCGFYADNDAGGCSMTGEGEQIMRVVLAKAAVDKLRNGSSPEYAARAALDLMKQRVGGEAGCILLDCNGRIGWMHISPQMAVAYRVAGLSDAKAFVEKSEEAHCLEVKCA